MLPTPETNNSLMLETVNTFATAVGKAIEGYLAVTCAVEPTGTLRKGIVSAKDFAVSILFTGTAYGEFILMMDERCAAAFVSTLVPSGANQDEIRTTLSETFGEILNMSVGETIPRLSPLHKKLTFTSPRTYFGHVRYPSLHSAVTKLTSTHGEIECHLYVDRVQLDIASSYKKVLTSLLSANKELQKAMQTLQDQQLKLVQAEKYSALGTMAGGVAHEINTPLTTISLVEGEMRAMLSADPSDKRALSDMLDTVDSMVARISKITNALKSYAKSNGNEKLTQAPVKLLFDQALVFCEQQLASSGVELRMAPISDALRIECRQSEIANVIFSLIANAFDAVEHQPVKWIQIEAIDASDSVEIRVSDSGDGVPVRILNRIFDPFFTSKPVGKGTGLGLSLAKGIAAAHGGSLILESPQVPTRFVLRLPKSQPKPQVA